MKKKSLNCVDIMRFSAGSHAEKWVNDKLAQYRFDDLENDTEFDVEIIPLVEEFIVMIKLYDVD